MRKKVRPPSEKDSRPSFPLKLLADIRQRSDQKRADDHRQCQHGDGQTHGDADLRKAFVYENFQTFKRRRQNDRQTSGRNKTEPCRADLVDLLFVEVDEKDDEYKCEKQQDAVIRDGQFFSHDHAVYTESRQGHYNGRHERHQDDPEIIVIP